MQMLKSNNKRNINFNQLPAFHLNWKCRVVKNEKLKKRNERSKQQTGNGWQKQEANTNNRRPKTQRRNQTNIQASKRKNKTNRSNKQTHKQTNTHINKQKTNKQTGKRASK